jgi:hypothetical protein
MSYKPSDFYVGVVELFGVFLPGAALAFLFSADASALLNGRILPKLSGGFEVAVAFLVVSYILGEGMDAVGSIVLDWFTDWAYKDRKAKTSPKLMAEATKAREAMLGQNQDMVSGFRWSRTIVALMSPEGTRAIERLEAEAKFFRSLTLLFAIAAIKFFLSGAVAFGLGAIVFSGFALARTAVERWQRNKTAYELFIAQAAVRRDRPPNV